MGEFHSPGFDTRSGCLEDARSELVRAVEGAGLSSPLAVSQRALVPMLCSSNVSDRAGAA